LAQGGRKYRLLIYEHILNRWWPITLMLAVFIFLIVGVLWVAKGNFANPADNPFPVLSTSANLGMIAIGVISLVVTFYLIITRKMAYIQLFEDHFRMVTPFLRMNIAYKRVQNSITTQMYKLFPPKSLARRNLNIVDQVMGNTVVVIRLTAYPISRSSLGLFLSPFFFYDKSPHFVLLLDDWLLFTTELETRLTLFRAPRVQAPRQVKKSSSGLLDDLNRK
jgi:hypothetical protein